jgi:hypothetical protein
MPFHSEEGTFTTQQIADLHGEEGVYAELITRAFRGAMKDILNGPKRVIEIETRKPKEIENSPGTFLARVLIRYWLAEPDVANIGDIVYGPLLKADYKGENAPRFEATYKGMRFDPDEEGWTRVE